MLRLLIPLLCAIPSLAPPDPVPDFALVSKSGRLRLLGPTTQPVALSFPDAYWQAEGSHTHLTLTESADGLSLWVALDEAGPWWVYLELIQGRTGLVLDIRHSKADSWHLRAEYSSYAALRVSTEEPALLCRAVLSRCGLSVCDLDPPQTLSPTAAILARAAELVNALDADRWATRQHATDLIAADPTLRAGVAVVARGKRLSLEQRMRLASLLDLPTYAPDPPAGVP